MQTSPWVAGEMLALALIGSVASIANADDYDVEGAGLLMAMACNGCSEVQVLDKAEAAGHGERYYYDLIANVMHYVVTECEPAGGGGVTCNAYEEAVPALVQARFGDYRTLWLQNASSESFNQQIVYTAPSGNLLGPDGKPVDNGFVNAFDTVTITQFDDDVVAYLNSPFHYSGFYAALILFVEPLGNPIVQFDKLTVVVVVVFVDHSKRTYKFDKSTRSFVALKGSARDANGNEIPEATPPTGRTFLFNRDPSQNHYDERNVTQILPVTPPGLPPKGCIQEKWDGQRLTCVLPRP
jgi:hypothetical protein